MNKNNCLYVKRLDRPPPSTDCIGCRKPRAKVAETSASSIAFSRTDEPATCGSRDAVVIRGFGDVPSMEELLSSRWVRLQPRMVD